MQLTMLLVYLKKIMEKSNIIFYGSALLAILATMGYHFFIKKIPADINPLISVLAIYVFVLIMALIALPFMLSKHEIVHNIQKNSWIQLAIAFAVIGMELGFLLMYRYGWDLSLGNVVTGVFINIGLVTIGILLLKEALSSINLMGIVLCVVGVAMIGYRNNN